MTLEWNPKRPDERGYRSTCGKYSVCSIGEGENEKWETWKLAPGGPWFAQLATGLADEATARAAAERDCAR